MTPRCRALIVVLGDLGRSPRMLNHARALRARGWAVTLAGYTENALPPDLNANPRMTPASPTGSTALRSGSLQGFRANPWEGIPSPSRFASTAGTSSNDDSDRDPPAVRVVDLLDPGAALQPNIPLKPSPSAQPGFPAASTVSSERPLPNPGQAPNSAPFWRLSTALPRLLTELQRQRWTAVIVQNPPGFPALAICALAATPGTPIVLDWHNLGGTLLALRPSARRRWAPLYSWCEAQAARFADCHWAVSAALSGHLKPRAVTIVYDQPAKVFCAAAAQAAATDRKDRLTWWRRVLPDRPLPEGQLWIAAPSSWGPDEDHGAILRAAEYWKANYLHWGNAPPITIIATGKGPGQQEFAQAASALAGGPVTLQTVWIPAQEYPAFLAHADAGLGLHRSSSGLDLPMKLADFRGARLPALVLNYGPVLAETFRDGEDGWTFRSDQELAQALLELAQTSSDPPQSALQTRIAMRWSAISERAGPDRVLAATTLPPPAEVGSVRKPSPTEPTTWEDEWQTKLGAWAEHLERRESAPCI